MSFLEGGLLEAFGNFIQNSSPDTVIIDDLLLEVQAPGKIFSPGVDEIDD